MVLYNKTLPNGCYLNLNRSLKRYPLASDLEPGTKTNQIVL